MAATTSTAAVFMRRPSSALLCSSCAPSTASTPFLVASGSVSSAASPRRCFSSTSTVTASVGGERECVSRSGDEASSRAQGMSRSRPVSALSPASSSTSSLRWTGPTTLRSRTQRGLATAAASTSSSSSASARDLPGSPTPAVHLPTLARLSPSAYNSLRPAPLSSVSALAARLHPSFLPRIDGASPAEVAQTRARRIALVERALTHPSWFTLWENTQQQFPEAFVAGANAGTSPVGAGRGVVVQSLETVRGGEGHADAKPSNLKTEDGSNPRNRNVRVQSVLLASSQYLPIPTSLTSSGSSKSPSEQLHNAGLSNLGNSLLGLFASEHLHLRYPHIPTRVLKAALASYAGPSTSADVAFELGVQGSLIRWDPTRLQASAAPNVDPSKPRTESGLAAALEDAAVKERQRKVDVMLARMNRRKKGFVGTEGELQAADDGSATYRRQDVFASVMRALVAVLYQELGVSVARHFVSSHFLTRLVPLPSFLKFTDPKRVLSSTLNKYGLAPPQSRLIAETGRLSIAPVFIVGIWSDQNKIGEGSGSSLRMAEYRAAEDALRRLYLAESDPAGFQVPSLTMEVAGSGTGAAALPTASFVSQPLGRSEVVHGSQA
ncbi:hypothetical protein CF326_g125 [Tilletia indica]|nr:hypothetical protein CF326_g125 [Tilletia indica]